MASTWGDTASFERRLGSAQLRIARPTNQLEAVAEFYCEVLGFDRLGQFADHVGFDGIMLGHAGAGYHLEFTHERCNTDHQTAPSPEHLLVFYVPGRTDWDAMRAHLQERGVETVPAHNPYWDVRGITIEDPDGYRIVIQNDAWPS